LNMNAFVVDFPEVGRFFCLTRLLLIPFHRHPYLNRSSATRNVRDKAIWRQQPFYRTIREKEELETRMRHS
jgi:hypothetical protein